MTMLQAVPVLAYLAAAAAILAIALGRELRPGWRWLLPASLGAAFLAYSVLVVAEGGLLPFWVNHTSNAAGNQVWLDLLIAVAVAFHLIAPRARAVGVRLLPWAIAVLATASLALLPLLARVVWLEQRARHAPRP
jgi:uncharacterized membrane protein YccF (DUF307 family)